MTTGCTNGRLEDPRAYFFSLIDRVEGSPAPDWKAVLESLPVVHGMGVNPQPGEIQEPNAACCGITLMVGAGGARGRIWLPSDGPPNVDDQGNAWFTHEIQVIADGPTPGSFIWAWQDKGGAPYSPHACDGGTPPTPEPPVPPSDIEQRLAALEATVAALNAEAVRNGERVSLSTSDELHYVGADGGGGADVDAQSFDVADEHVLFRLWRRGG